MKRITLAVVVLAALALASAASASSLCRPALRSDLSLSSSGTSCQTARALERFSMTHATLLARSFHFERRTWRGSSYRWRGRLYEQYASGSRYVWIVTRHVLS